MNTLGPRTIKSDEPKFNTIRLFGISGPDLKLDAKHYQEEFIVANQRVANSSCAVRRILDIATVFVPGRMKLITIPTSDGGPPYLKAHDIFMTRPQTNRFLSQLRTDNYETYLLNEGYILTPSSGRNLGPITYVGPYLSKFAMTDIMRIVPHNNAEGHYLLCYLMTPTAQALIRRGRTGTTVDHLAPNDVLNIPIIWPSQETRAALSHKMKRSVELLERSRHELDALESELHQRANLPLPVTTERYLSKDGARTFSLNASQLQLRLDSAYYDPLVLSCRNLVKHSGGAELASCAEMRMLGRYKRYYVKEGYGTPILSGRQLLQLRPVNQKYISDRSFKNPSDFLVKKGWTLFTCDGRSEQSLGAPSYVYSLRDGWMASNHVMRAIPKDHIEPGYLYLALRSPYVQTQLKARATGSVVDALDPFTISDVLILILSSDDRKELGRAVDAAWDNIAQSVRLSNEAVDSLEGLIVDSYEAVSTIRSRTR